MNYNLIQNLNSKLAWNLIPARNSTVHKQAER